MDSVCYFIWVLVYFSWILLIYINKWSCKIYKIVVHYTISESFKIQIEGAEKSKSYGTQTSFRECGATWNGNSSYNYVV